jgi:hypothetical protein
VACATSVFCLPFFFFFFEKKNTSPDYFIYPSKNSPPSPFSLHWHPDSPSTGTGASTLLSLHQILSPPSLPPKTLSFRPFSSPTPFSPPTGTATDDHLHFLPSSPAGTHSPTIGTPSPYKPSLFFFFLNNKPSLF